MSVFPMVRSLTIWLKKKMFSSFSKVRRQWQWQWAMAVWKRKRFRQTLVLLEEHSSPDMKQMLKWILISHMCFQPPAPGLPPHYHISSHAVISYHPYHHHTQWLNSTPWERKKEKNVKTTLLDCWISQHQGLRRAALVSCTSWWLRQWSSEVKGFRFPFVPPLVIGNVDSRGQLECINTN